MKFPNDVTRVTCRSLLISLFLMLSSSLIVSCQEQTDAYSIGVLLPLTGPGSYVGSSALLGMQAAVEDVNDNDGVNGANLQLIVEDSKLNPSVSALAAKSLAARDVSLISAWFHLPAEAASPIAFEHNIPFFYEAYTVSILDKNPFAYKGHFDAFVGCAQLAEFAKSQKRYTKLGALMSSTEYNDLCLEGLMEIEESIEIYRYNFGSTDFQTLLTKAFTDDVDALVTIMIDFEYVALFKQLSELGYPIKIYCATSSECIFEDVVSVSSPTVLENTLGIDFIPPSAFDSTLALRLKENHDLDRNTLAYALVGYDETILLSTILAACGFNNQFDCINFELSHVKEYNSVIGSQGFYERKLVFGNTIYEYDSNEWVPVKTYI